MHYLFCVVKYIYFTIFELRGIFKYLKLISNIVKKSVSPINGLKRKNEWKNRNKTNTVDK